MGHLELAIVKRRDIPGRSGTFTPGEVHSSCIEGRKRREPGSELQTKPHQEIVCNARDGISRSCLRRKRAAAGVQLARVGSEIEPWAAVNAGDEVALRLPRSARSGCSTDRRQ